MHCTAKKGKKFNFLKRAAGRLYRTCFVYLWIKTNKHSFKKIRKCKMTNMEMNQLTSSSREENPFTDTESNKTMLANILMI
jgi:hypothetical protein